MGTAQKLDITIWSVLSERKRNFLDYYQRENPQGNNLTKLVNTSKPPEPAYRRSAMPTPELLPCPCGGKPRRHHRDTGPTNAIRKWVECPKCGKSTSVHLSEYYDDNPADGEWNVLARRGESDEKE